MNKKRQFLHKAGNVLWEVVVAKRLGYLKFVVEPGKYQGRPPQKNPFFTGGGTSVRRIPNA